MRKDLLVSAVLITGFFSSCIAHGNGSAKAIPSQKRVAFIGDSCLETLEPLAIELARTKNAILKYETHCGAKAVDWLSEPSWGSWIDKFDPQTVIINLGTKEAMVSHMPEGLAVSFQILVDRLSKNGSRKMIWVTPPYTRQLKHLNSVREAARRLNGVKLLDFSAKAYLPHDGARFKSKAYSLWVNEMADALNI